MKKSMETTLYKIGLVLLIAVPALWLFINKTNIAQLPCIFHMFTGFYCPGCGGTRAMRALFHGHLLQSLFYHPFVPYCAILYAWFMISHTIEYISRGRLTIGMKFRTGYLYFGLILILFQWLIKNVVVLFLSQS